MVDKQDLTACIALAVLALLLVWSNLAKAESGPPPGDPQQFMTEFDTNQDGKVSQEEFPGPDNLFNRLDKNNDGFIDQSEIPKRRPKRDRNFMADFDQDGDNKISKDEFPGPDEHFARLDKNNDGFIDESEIPKRRPKHGRNLMTDFDTDNDGKVSKDEFQGPDEIFTRLDQNNDGFIDRSEIPKKRPGRDRNFIADFDKDGDGKVSKDEFPGPKDHLTRLDKNNDGFIDSTEAPQGPPPGHGPGGLKGPAGSGNPS
jgi:Ca2+-binding EF-hand superfamily protein